jgi:acyl-CoA carboxylase subunit beta
MSLARHPDRPKASDYLSRILSEFVEIHGDRLESDDRTVICGIGRLEGASVALVAQERWMGERAQATASGYRKAIRTMRLAGHLEVPLVVLVEAPDASSISEADSADVGVALGQLLGLMSLLPIPVVTAIIGEAGSIGALAFGIGDRLLMQEHAVFTVAGLDSFVRGESAHSTNVASAHRVTARDCLRLGIVDDIVPEPEPGAHADPDQAARMLMSSIVHALGDISGAAPRRLLDDRSRRVRMLGLATPESREATRIELTELQELQRSISRSFGDLRERFENRQLSLPNLSNRPHLPSLPQLRKINVNRADIEAFAGKLAATGRGLVRGQSLPSREQDVDILPDPPESKGETR